MKNFSLSLFLIFLFTNSYAQSNHISPDMGEDDVVVMKLGPFLNNSENAIAIHKAKYAKIKEMEDAFEKIQNENSHLKSTIDELILMMTHIEFELSECKNKKRKRKR
jgi:hypothetical protein